LQIVEQPGALVLVPLDQAIDVCEIASMMMAVLPRVLRRSVTVRMSASNPIDLSLIKLADGLASLRDEGSSSIKKS
jgi:hypothetical protein